jgi:hypothetical protein
MNEVDIKKELEKKSFSISKDIPTLKVVFITEVLDILIKHGVIKKSRRS